MEKVRIWCGGEDALPTVYMHSVAGDGHCVWEACRRIGCPDFNLVSIYDFDFDGDLTPWPAQGVRKRQPPFKGNAKSHLAEMLDRIMPEALQFRPLLPRKIAVLSDRRSGKKMKIFSPQRTFQTIQNTKQLLSCVEANIFIISVLVRCTLTRIGSEDILLINCVLINYPPRTLNMPAYDGRHIQRFQIRRLRRCFTRT